MGGKNKSKNKHKRNVKQNRYPQFIDEVCVVCYKPREFCDFSPAPIVFLEFPFYLEEVRMHFYTCNLLPEHEWFTSFSTQGCFSIEVDKYLISYYEMDTWELYFKNKWTKRSPELIRELKEYYDMALFRELWNEDCTVHGLCTETIRPYVSCNSWGENKIWDLNVIKPATIFSVQNDTCIYNFHENIGTDFRDL